MRFHQIRKLGSTSAELVRTAFGKIIAHLIYRGINQFYKLGIFITQKPSTALLREHERYLQGFDISARAEQGCRILGTLIPL